MEEIIMNRMKHSIAAIVTVTALATGALVVTSLPSAAADAEMPIATTAAEHSAEAAKYEQEALELDAKAARHTELASQYAAHVSGGSKQADAQRSISKHCERLAKAYRAAATDAREMAKMHREMAQAT
jgi:hypothetical protein